MVLFVWESFDDDELWSSVIMLILGIIKAHDDIFFAIGLIKLKTIFFNFRGQEMSKIYFLIF